MKDLFEMMIEVLANRDQYTFDHALHVAVISNKIGEKMNLSADELEILELGCLVHDIGKTAIPDDILLKPDRFDVQDRKIMDYHPLIAAKLISRHIQDDRITDTILKHHECLDGSVLFKKGLDYLIYSECEEPYSRSQLLEEIEEILDQAETDWHLVSAITSHQFSRGTPVVQAICRLLDLTNQCNVS